MLNFKCVLKCLTAVLKHKLEAYSFSKQNKKEGLQTNLRSANIFRLLLQQNICI